MSRWYRPLALSLTVFVLAPLAGPASAQTAAPINPSTVPVITPIPTGPAQPLTLEDAVRAGLQNNFALRQAALSVALARAQLRQAQAGKQPAVSGAASFSDMSTLGTPPLTGTITIPGIGVMNQQFVADVPGASPQSWQFGLTLRYPLYTGNALEDQIAIAGANVRIAEATFTAQVEQTVLSVRQAYYQVEEAQGTVEAAQRAVAASQENVRVTQAQVRVGTSPQFFLLQAQVQLAQAQQSLTAANTTLVQAQQSLAAVLSLPLPTVVAPQTPMGLPAPPADLDTLVRQALVNRPELLEVRASEDAARASIDLAASGLRPNVTVSGGPAIQTSDPTTHDPVIWSALVALTITVFDGGLTQAKIDAAKTQLQQATVTEEQTRQSIELDVRNAYIGLINATDTLRSALTAQASARETLRIANVRFQAGVGTQLDVVTAVQNLAAADNSVVAAQFAYNLALAQMDRAIGVQVKF